MDDDNHNPEQDAYDLDMPGRRELPEADAHPSAEIKNLIDDILAGLKCCGMRIGFAEVVAGSTPDIGHLVINGKLMYTIVVRRDADRNIIAYDTLTPYPTACPPIPGVR